jgi:signal peptide peptidase SppA
MLPGRGQQQTAVVKLTGTLMKQQSSLGGNNTSTIAARRAIRSAAADPNVSGILLAIDSPGGTVAGTADLAADVKAASRKKPVIAHIDDLGASAAYWIASQADAVYANTPTALVGSIGTVLSITDSSGAGEKSGVKTMTFATGPLKAAGYDGTPITDEQAAYFQGLVDSLQQEFDAAVQRGRRLSDTKLAAVKSGAVYPAAEAQPLGLIDGVQPLEKSLALLTSAK